MVNTLFLKANPSMPKTATKMYPAMGLIKK